jgi:hypothetical protein
VDLAIHNEPVFQPALKRSSGLFDLGELIIEFNGLLDFVRELNY